MVGRFGFAAREYYEASLKMQRQVHGGEEAVHLSIATSLHALGTVCSRESKYAEAREYYERRSRWSGRCTGARRRCIRPSRRRSTSWVACASKKATFDLQKT